ncbi:hypothetical protein PO654_11170 [Phytobacter diazotrophicus]|jgi:hypothetical protein|uniref:hypothetical protein n=1 Tax=Phytobacter diazotrophicus TaxID=395631 RepID=UPI002914A4F7|nr:hypothetical protein [Phytobacter diazotrophicus]MBS6740109.1 hypothetical protein [Enterobacteriaceae bacterium]MDU4355654.1 hypothetical protein [Phytobacter diazotrophicus]MDU7200617.1 hypothetical protein [Enterobacteriaceae bacterium]MDV2873230.1 hypothetical protein [Phytobacter diazotrophicus]
MSTLVKRRIYWFKPVNQPDKTGRFERSTELDVFPQIQKITTEVVVIQLTVSLVGAMRNPS